MALVEQLGDDSWWVVCAACCHMALVFAIVHIMLFCFLLCLFISFFRFLFCNTGRRGMCRGRLGCGPCVMSFLVSSGHPLTWLCPIEFSPTRNSTRQSYVVWHTHTGMAASVYSTAGLAVCCGCRSSAEGVYSVDTRVCCSTVRPGTLDVLMHRQRCLRLVSMGLHFLFRCSHSGIRAMQFWYLCRQLVQLLHVN